MDGKVNTGMGQVTVSCEVLEKYAGLAAMDCIGIVGMSMLNVKDGVAKLLKQENAGRGVTVTFHGGKLAVELHVIMAYGVSIRAVAQNVLESVRYKLEEYTGFPVERINVIVEGVRISEEDQVKN